MFEGGFEVSEGEVGGAVVDDDGELGPFFVESGEIGKSFGVDGSSLVCLGRFLGPREDAACDFASGFLGIHENDAEDVAIAVEGEDEALAVGGFEVEGR